MTIRGPHLTYLSYLTTALGDGIRRGCRLFTIALVVIAFLPTAAAAETHVHNIFRDMETAGGVTFGWSENVNTNLQSDDDVDNTSFIDQESWVDIGDSSWVEAGMTDGSLTSIGGCKDDGCAAASGSVNYHGAFWAYALASGDDIYQYDEHMINDECSTQNYPFAIFWYSAGNE